MAGDNTDDAVWQTAIDWLMREHENGTDRQAREELRAWLAESPRHRKAYEEAARLWLITGIVPPGDERR